MNYVEEHESSHSGYAHVVVLFGQCILTSVNQYQTTYDELRLSAPTANNKIKITKEESAGL